MPRVALRLRAYRVRRRRVLRAVGDRPSRADVPGAADRDGHRGAGHRSGPCRAAAYRPRHPGVRLRCPRPARERQLPPLRRARSPIRGVERGGDAGAVAGAQAVVLPRSRMPELSRLLLRIRRRDVRRGAGSPGLGRHRGRGSCVLDTRLVRRSAAELHGRAAGIPPRPDHLPRARTPAALRPRRPRAQRILRGRGRACGGGPMDRGGRAGGPDRTPPHRRRSRSRVPRAAARRAPRPRCRVCVLPLRCGEAGGEGAADRRAEGTVCGATDGVGGRSDLRRLVRARGEQCGDRARVHLRSVGPRPGSAARAIRGRPPGALSRGRHARGAVPG